MTEQTKEQRSSILSIISDINNTYAKLYPSAEANVAERARQISQLDQLISEEMVLSAKNPILNAEIDLLRQDNIDYKFMMLLNMIKSLTMAVGIASLGLDEDRKKHLAVLAEEAEKKKQEFDEHVAQRLSKLFSASGHEAMYGSGAKG
jgi:hypothetical protein